MLFVPATRIMNNSSKKRISTTRQSNKHKNKYDTNNNFFTIDELVSTNTNNNKTLLTPQHSTKYQHEGKRENKDKHKLVRMETKTDESTCNKYSQSDISNTCHTIHSNITSIAIGRTLAHQAINNAFLQLITTTNTKQRQQIKRYYKQQYSFDLNDYINQHFKGIFKRILLYSMQNQMERDLYILQIGIKKKKDINSILPLLCILEHSYLSKLMNTYETGRFEKTLREQIIKLTGKNALLRSFIVSILNGSRKRLPSRLLQTDAEFLNDIFLYKSEWNTRDEIKFIDIFTRRSFEYLRTLCASFESLADMSLMDAIKFKFGYKNSIGNAINCMLMYALDSKEFYRKLLMKGIVNGGHKNILFWRIIINKMDYNLMEILNSYGLYEDGRSDVDSYNLYHFIKVTLHKQDEFTSRLLLKICKF